MITALRFSEFFTRSLRLATLNLSFNFDLFLRAAMAMPSPAPSGSHPGESGDGRVAPQKVGTVITLIRTYLEAAAVQAYRAKVYSIACEQARLVKQTSAGVESTIHLGSETGLTQEDGEFLVKLASATGKRSAEAKHAVLVADLWHQGAKRAFLKASAELTARLGVGLSESVAVSLTKGAQLRRRFNL
jgi:hypothetical protein